MWNQGKGICRKGTFLNKIQVQPGMTGQTAKRDMLTLFPNYHGIYFFIPFKDAGNQIKAFLSKGDLQFCILALWHIVFPLCWQKNVLEAKQSSVLSQDFLLQILSSQDLQFSNPCYEYITMQIPYFILTPKSDFLGNMLCSVLTKQSSCWSTGHRWEQTMGTMPISNASSSRKSAFQKVAF